MPVSMVSSSRPCAVVVSHQVSASDLKAICRSPSWVQDVQQITGGSGQPVEPGHHQHVTGLKHPHHLGQLGPNQCQARLNAGETQTDVARSYNVDATTIGRLLA
jgi:hypothetical protein